MLRFLPSCVTLQNVRRIRAGMKPPPPIAMNRSGVNSDMILGAVAAIALWMSLYDRRSLGSAASAASRERASAWGGGVCGEEGEREAAEGSEIEISRRGTERHGETRDTARKEMAPVDRELQAERLSDGGRWRWAKHGRWAEGGASESDREQNLHGGRDERAMSRSSIHDQREDHGRAKVKEACGEKACGPCDGPRMTNAS